MLCKETDRVFRVEKKQPKKQVIKLPWELITPFQDLLRNLPNWTTSNEEEDNDDEELEAYEDSIQRLRVRVFWVIRE